MLNLLMLNFLNDFVKISKKNWNAFILLILFVGQCCTLACRTIIVFITAIINNNTIVTFMFTIFLVGCCIGVRCWWFWLWLLRSFFLLTKVSFHLLSSRSCPCFSFPKLIFFLWAFFIFWFCPIVWLFKLLSTL